MKDPMARTVFLTGGFLLLSWAGLHMSTISILGNESKATKTALFFVPITDESAIKGRSFPIESLQKGSASQRQRKLKGKKKKKRPKYESPAKAQKLSAAPPPAPAPIYQSTPFPSYGSERISKSGGAFSAFQRQDTPSPTINTIRAYDVHESNQNDSEKGKGKKSSGKMKKTKDKGSKSIKKTSKHKDHHPTAAQPHQASPFPSVFSVRTTMPPSKQPQVAPPFQNLINVPSLFRPPTEAPSSTSVPLRTPAPLETGQPKHILASIEPTRGNTRPTLPLIVLSPVRVQNLTTQSPTILILSPSPSKNSVALLFSSDLPTTNVPSSVIDAPYNFSLIPFGTSSTLVVPAFDAANTTRPTKAPISNDSTMVPSSNTTAMPFFQDNTTSLTPTPIPTPDNGIRRVAVPRMYLAFSAVDAERAPTPQETIFVVQTTTLYFEEVFANLYRDSEFSFEQVEMELIADLYEARIPDEQFNIYLELDTSVIFRIVNDTVQLPQPSDLFNRMVEAVDTTYLVDYIWQDSESPYFWTQEIVADAVPLPTDLQRGDEARKPNVENSPSMGIAITGLNVTLSESVKQLEGRFILPGSNLPDGLFRINDVLEEEESNH